MKFSIDFWCSDTEEIFQDKAKKLIELGMSENEAKIFLENLYYSVSWEYGN